MNTQLSFPSLLPLFYMQHLRLYLEEAGDLLKGDIFGLRYICTEVKVKMPTKCFPSLTGNREPSYHMYKTPLCGFMVPCIE